MVLWIGSGFAVMYYNYHLSPPARLRDHVKLGDQYQKVIELFTRYQEKYKNDPDVSVGQGITEERTAAALKLPRGKYIHLYHWIFLDDLQLWIYFDSDDKVAHIEYVGD